MTYKFIELDIKDYVATVTLARMESLNALSLELALEITDVFKKLGAMDEVRVAILQSKARIFCAGLDLKDAASSFGDSAKGIFNAIKRIQPLFDCCNAIEECPKPVIAAVHGKCIGGGLDMIAACDIRICSEDAIFSLKEANIGLVADMGVLQRLPLIVGQGFAREMAYTAGNYPARKAEKMGLVSDVYADKDALMAAAQQLANEIAANAPLAIQCTKEVLNFSRYTSVSEGMALAVQKNMFLLTTQDLKEAFIAFMEKRKPDFKGK
ncbi:MAG: enoyl-CoA hydratase [Deltaproteobacteria bacterium HGW-Deltaproteobacteria-10]|nr:MAG: enoyl-CoA hydratase [Deltaproteobacteria bacterium HGW-Deltaproteobacteria-10]